MRTAFFFVTLFILGACLFGHTLSLYFSQDDFFHLKVSQLDVNNGFLKMISFRPFADRGGIYFYRPLFRELLFNIYFKVFGPTPLPFRILQFAVFFINLILVYLVSFKITKSKFISIFSAFFVSLAAANIGILSYLSGGIQVAGMTTMAFLSLTFYLDYLETGAASRFWLTFAFFILALASHEIALVLPFLYLFLFLFKKGITTKKLLLGLKKNIPFFAIALAFLLADVFIIGLPVGEQQYGLNLSVSKLANSYFWYGLWSIGVPEMLLDFVGPGLKLNPDLMRFWGPYFRYIFPAIFGILVLSFLTLAKLVKDKRFIFYLAWFVIGIAPVAILPFHRQYIYLGFVLPATGSILGIIFLNLKRRKILTAVFVICVLLLNFGSIKLANKTYWAINRANIAKSLIAEITGLYPSLPKGAKVYIKNDPSYPVLGKEWGGSSKQASIILSGSDALQMVYNDPNLTVFYEDIQKPESLKGVYSLQPKVLPQQ